MPCSPLPLASGRPLVSGRGLKPAIRCEPLFLVPSPARERAWIETDGITLYECEADSSPARERAWIETLGVTTAFFSYYVARS